MKLLRRLASLAPPPRMNLTRFHGVFAPGAKLRPFLVPAAAAAGEQEALSEATSHEKRQRAPGLDGAGLLKRTLTCRGTVHLALSTSLLPAAPAHEVPTVAPGGRLRASWADFARAWLFGRVRREALCAQLSRARALGAEVDHLDGHQHLLPALTRRTPAGGGGAARASPVSSAVLRAGPGERSHDRRGHASGQRTGRPSRAASRSTPGLTPGSIFEAGRLTEAALLALLEALTSPRVRQHLITRGIQLTTYAALASR